MNEQSILESINNCVECKECLRHCQTYQETNDELFSPFGRLKIAKKVFEDEEITEKERKSLYTCTMCSLCDETCPQEIETSHIVHEAKFRLYGTEKGQYKIHDTIIGGILKKDNSVNGDPKERLDWLPEKYKKEERYDNKKSDTLLFLGCMSSYKVKESASSTYQLLKEADFDFKILKDEPCCGEYIYSAGNLDEAIKYFKKVNEILKKNNIKTIIVTCAGCLYAFNNVYSKYLDDYNVNVKHNLQVIAELEKQGKLEFSPKTLENIAYHDACRMGRKLNDMKLYSEPRELISKCGIEIQELSKNENMTPCCGAGSGVRGVDKNLCIKMGNTLLEELNTDQLLSACPLCVFNFRYVNYKKGTNKRINYITEFLRDSVKK
ncbi:MAG: putative iron-sulfur binding reductase [Promethearchaeota archaeon]|nr:MAG: putative iron-sulfur binding reductase [Candidatus Lokiarchaeota archaeon]